MHSFWISFVLSGLISLRSSARWLTMPYCTSFIIALVYGVVRTVQGCSGRNILYRVSVTHIHGAEEGLLSHAHLKRHTASTLLILVWLNLTTFKKKKSQFLFKKISCCGAFYWVMTVRMRQSKREREIKCNKGPQLKVNPGTLNS